MKLDRNVNPDGKGKYRLFNLRQNRWVDDCGPDQEHEFFVLMLKDQHAEAALRAYAESVRSVDPQFASEVEELAERATNPFWRREPD